MNPDFKDISVITDIAANTFAVFLLILLLLLAAQVDPASSPTDGRATETVLDVDGDLASVLRTPLRPEDIIDTLYDRGSAARGTRIDLFDDRVEIVSGNGIRQITAGGPAATTSIAAAMEVPISLYVFDHRFYRTVLDGLLASRRVWRELSVPQALRRRDPATGRQTWSAGFLQLLARQLDRASFRLELARLLGSQQPSDQASGQGNAKSSSGAFDLGDEQPSSLVEMISRWWHAIVDAAMILGGLLFVFFVEAAGQFSRTELADSDRGYPN